jgi:integrase
VIDVIGTRQLEYLANTALTIWGRTAIGVTVRAMILVAAYTGIRPSELFALEHTFVDHAAGRLRVPYQFDRYGQPQDTKTGDPRVVVLLSPASAAISDVPRRLGTSLIFQSQRGCAYTNSLWYHYWSQVRAAFGAPAMDFYDLRHYCATLLIRQGLSPGEVAVQLGHNDKGIRVMQTYNHVEHDEALERITQADQRGLVPLRDHANPERLGWRPGQPLPEMTPAGAFVSRDK